MSLGRPRIVPNTPEVSEGFGTVRIRRIPDREGPIRGRADARSSDTRRIEQASTPKGSGPVRALRGG